jgi:hypothetical protein
MKKYALIFQVGFLFCLYCQPVAAQVRLGVKAGGNMSNIELRGFLVDYNDALVGFHVGVLAEIKLSEKLYLRPELLYAQKGWIINERPLLMGSVGDRKMEFNYASLPVLAGYRILPIWSMVAGPEVGYLLQTNTNPNNYFYRIDYFKFKKWDVGIVLGTSVNLSEHLGIEARYIYGLTPISTVITRNENANLTGYFSNGYNRILQAGLYYRFGQKP